MSLCDKVNGAEGEVEGDNGRDGERIGTAKYDPKRGRTAHGGLRGSGHTTKPWPAELGPMEPHSVHLDPAKAATHCEG